MRKEGPGDVAPGTDVVQHIFKTYFVKRVI